MENVKKWTITGPAYMYTRMNKTWKLHMSVEGEVTMSVLLN